MLPKPGSRGTVSSSTIVLLDTVRLLLGFRGARASNVRAHFELGSLENRLERAFDPTSRWTSDPTNFPPSLTCIYCPWDVILVFTICLYVALLRMYVTLYVCTCLYATLYV